MKSRPILPKEYQKVVDDAVKQGCITTNKKYLQDFDLLLVYCLHRTQGWGKKRLKTFYDDFIKLYTDIQDNYKFDDEDSNIWYAEQELKKLGVDVRQWQKDLGVYSDT